MAESNSDRKRKYKEKTRRFEVAYTIEEANIIAEKAKELNYSSPNKYIKQASLTGVGKKIKPSNSVLFNPDLSKIELQLRYIGNNINQLSKQFNSLVKENKPQEFILNSKNLDKSILELRDILDILVKHNS